MASPDTLCLVMMISMAALTKLASSRMRRVNPMVTLLPIVTPPVKPPDATEYMPPEAESS